MTELLAAGNQLIFKDIAPPFWRFLDLLDALSDQEISAYTRRADLQAVLSDELKLDPRSLDQTPDGEQLMVLAFEQYLRALVEPDADARAERMFVANGCVGLQNKRASIVSWTRCSSSPRSTTLSRMCSHRCAPVCGLARVRHTSYGPTVSKTFGERGPEIERKIRNYRRLFSAIFFEGRATQVLGTQLLLELQLGTTHFDLGEDISEARFAPGLRHITLGSTDFQSTFQKVAAWDRTPDSAIDSAALDWSDLSDRMNYILDLFRTQQGQRKLNIHPLAS
ncbi:MAG: hypothetical protein R3E66_23640 [bacterium]